MIPSCVIARYVPILRPCENQLHNAHTGLIAEAEVQSTTYHQNVYRNTKEAAGK